MKSKRGAAVLSLLVGISSAVAALAGPDDAHPGPALEISVSADPVWERKISNEWEIQKSFAPTVPEFLTVRRGESTEVPYTLVITKSGITLRPASEDYLGIHGQICVRNSGSAATRDLRFFFQIESQHSDGWSQAIWQPIASATAEITPNDLEVRQSRCFPFRIAMNAAQEIEPRYRVSVTTSITNNSLLPDREFKYITHRELNPPMAPELIETDKTARIFDTPICPIGFECGGIVSGTITQSETQHFTLSLKNTSAGCGRSFELENRATLVTPDSGTRHQSAAHVRVSSGPCP